jgi:hypothetical protein
MPSIQCPNVGLIRTWLKTTFSCQNVPCMNLEFCKPYHGLTLGACKHNIVFRGFDSRLIIEYNESFCQYA